MPNNCQHINFGTNSQVHIHTDPKLGKLYTVTFSVVCADCGARAIYDMKERQTVVQKDLITLPIKFEEPEQQDTGSTPPGPPA